MDKVNAVAFLLLVLLFAIWFYGPWQTLCIDWGRERMFEARNALFDMAAEGKLSFSSPEYRELRYRIETSIRFAHRISWPTLLILLGISRRLRIPRRRSTRELINGLPVQWQEEAEQHARTVEWVILRLLLTRSLILFVAVAIGWVLVRCGAPIYWFCKQLSEQLIEATQNETLEDAVIRTRLRRTQS